MIFKNSAPPSLRLGLVVAQGVNPLAPSGRLDIELSERLHGVLSGGLSPQEDTYRSEIRDIFRNGSYKPTGRSKPASEYLLRAASEGTFPRINTLVDCCNYLSLSSLLPISIWDVEKAGTESFEFRLGRADESYIFNASGHAIMLKDLVVGCATFPDLSSRPIINGVKDSMGTKTDDGSLVVAAAVYAPMHDGPERSLEWVCSTFVDILCGTAPSASASFQIISSDATAHF